MSTITGTECGPPSGRSVAMWAMFGPAKSVRASASSVVMLSSPEWFLDGLAIVSPQPVGVVRHGALDVVLRLETGVLSQPADVEVVVGRPVRITAFREDDAGARHCRGDRGPRLAGPAQLRGPGRSAAAV